MHDDDDDDRDSCPPPSPAERLGWRWADEEWAALERFPDRYDPFPGNLADARERLRAAGLAEDDAPLMLMRASVMWRDQIHWMVRRRPGVRL